MLFNTNQIRKFSVNVWHGALLCYHLTKDFKSKEKQNTSHREAGRQMHFSTYPDCIHHIDLVERSMCLPLFFLKVSWEAAASLSQRHTPWQFGRQLDIFSTPRTSGTKRSSWWGSRCSRVIGPPRLHVRRWSGPDLHKSLTVLSSIHWLAYMTSWSSEIWLRNKAQARGNHNRRMVGVRNKEGKGMSWTVYKKQRQKANPFITTDAREQAVLSDLFKFLCNTQQKTRVIVQTASISIMALRYLIRHWRHCCIAGLFFKDFLQRKFASHE